LGYKMGRKRVQGLMRFMGPSSIPAKKRTTVAGGDEHRTYPYLLCNLDIDRPNTAWGSGLSVPQGAV